MRKTREVLRLHNELNLSNRQVGRGAGLSATKVGDIIREFKASGLSWPLPELSDSELAERLGAGNEASGGLRPLPDWEEFARELARPNVTIQLLWEEYLREHPDGYRYTQFCKHFRDWSHRSKTPTMRLEHKAGEKLFVDWAGSKIGYLDESGAMASASLFVATLGLSNYTFAQVYVDEKLPRWIEAHCDAFRFFGGVPVQVIPDNPKTGVTKPDYYDPELNPTYSELAAHYGVAVIPARVRRPQDKAKVENGVQFSQRWILAALRNVQFLSFAALREGVAEKNQELNSRSFAKLAGTRLGHFESLERQHLRPLPRYEFTFGRWQTATVWEDYHIQVDKHYYSVPWTHIGQILDVRISARMIEAYADGRRVACHKRSDEPGKATTDPAHRPPNHTAEITHTADKYLEEGSRLGPHVEQAMARILESFPHPEMGFRSCAGLKRMARIHGAERLDQACRTAIEHNICRYRNIANMLQNHREGRSTTPTSQTPNIQHANIRGSRYYAQKKGTDQCS